MKRQQIIESVAICGFIVMALAGVFLLNNRVKQAEFVFDYTETIPTNSAYYFTNSQPDVALDPALFQFDGLGVFTVPVTLADGTHTVTIRIVDKQAPQILFTATEIDRSHTTDLNTIVFISDLSDVTHRFSVDVATLPVGTHEITVTAVDAYGNEAQASEWVTINDSSVQSLFERKYDYAHNRLEDLVQQYLDEEGLTASEVALTYQALGTDEVWTLQDQQPLPAAAGYYMPLAMYVSDLLRSNSLQSEQELLVCSMCYPDEETLRQYPHQLGEKVPVSELLTSLLDQNSEVSAMILYQFMGGWDTTRQALHKYAPAVAEGVTADHFISLAYVHAAWRTLQRNQAQYDTLWTQLQHGQQAKYLTKYIAADHTAHQFNQVAGWHLDGGVVMTERPYVLTIAVNHQDGENIIGELALLVYYYHQHH